jgi:hypothetical protein
MSAVGYLATSIPLRLAAAGSAVAIPILAVQQLDDIALGGALVAASLAPAVIAAPLVGVALDRTRHPRRLTAAAALVTVAGYAAVSLLGVLPVPLIAVVLLIAGLAAPFYYGGLSSFVTDGIPDEARAYSYDGLSYNIASVAGPGVVAVAGLVGDARAGMVSMAIAALVGAFGTLGLTMHARPLVAESALQTIVAGLRHLTRHRPIAVSTTAGTIGAFGAGGLPIAAVALSLERAGTADDAAIIVTAFAIGGLIGALIWTARPPERLSPPLAMGGSAAIIGGLTLIAVFDLGFVWTVAVLGLSGVLTAANGVSLLLLRKQQSPLAVRSQVFTIGSGLRAMSGAAGAAVAGLLAGLDAGVLLAGVGAIWVVSALVMLGYPRGAEPVAEV